MNALFQPMDARFQLVVAKKGIKKQPKGLLYIV